jgi:hypothetical protein
MRITTSSIVFSSLLTLAACPGGGGDETGTASGASTSTTGPGTTSGGTTTTGSTTEATGGPTSGMTSGMTSTTTGSTSEGTTSPGTTSPGTTTGETTGEQTTTTGEPGSTSAGETTGGVGGGACQTDADCKLHDDCCSCYGLPKDEDDAICKALCDKSKCEQAGIDQAVCRFGQCTTEKVKCSGEVACDALPPECPPGELPGKTDACWTGGCVPAASCDAVEDCSQCPEELMCVEYQSFMITRVCEPIPADCDGQPSCACAGDLACEEPFGLCNDKIQNADLACACPAC